MALAVRASGLIFLNLHLENKARPALRRAQMDEAIEFIAGDGGPVMFGGDLNTSGRDDRIMTTGRLLKQQFGSPAAVGSKALTVGLDAAKVSPYFGYGKTALEAAKWLKAKEDPTSVLNPDHRLFRDLKDDLGVKPLDERDAIGFKHTYSTPRLGFVAGRTLDWLFLYDPSGRLQAGTATSYEKLVRDSGKGGQEPVSDHFPLATRIVPAPN